MDHPRLRVPQSPADQGRTATVDHRRRGTAALSCHRAALAVLMALAGTLALPASAQAEVPLCTEASRLDRRATCIDEGDMGIENGLPWVLLDVDTPSIANPGCPAEKTDGERARDRLIALMAPGYTLLDSGRRDRSRRARVNIRLADGRDAGSVLIAEDLAQPWRSKGNVWCGW